MECNKIQLVAILSFIFLVQNIQGWGEEGHAITCKIAQARLTDAAADAMKNCCLLMPIMICQVFVHGLIASSLLFVGRLLCTSLTLLLSFAISNMPVCLF